MTTNIEISEEKKLSKHDFSLKIDELAKRLNYKDEKLSRKERFIKKLQKYNRLAK